MDSDDGKTVGAELRACTMVESGYFCSMTMRAACLLRIPDILASEGEGVYLSPSQIASHFPTNSCNLDYLRRLMRFLSFQGVFSAELCVNDENGEESEWKFGINSISKWLASDHKPFSMASALLTITDKVMQRPCEHLHECILEGGNAFERPFGMPPWDVVADNPDFAQLFNQSMASSSQACMEVFLKSYHSFDDIHTLVDVGGNLGQAVASIVEKYPSVKGINFDLPRVIANAPTYPGVVHASGDIFQSVPKGDTILLKWVLHDWDDASCLRILKNCIKALPANGKVIILEIVLHEMKSYPLKQHALCLDLAVLLLGGRERTEKQWKALLTTAGFSAINFIDMSSTWSIIEAKL